MPKSAKNSVAAWNWWQFQPRVLEDADLRKPLRDEIEVADRRRCARTVRGTRDVQAIWTLTVSPGATARVERHLRHRAIVGVAVVGRDEAHGAT